MSVSPRRAITLSALGVFALAAVQIHGTNTLAQLNADNTKIIDDNDAGYSTNTAWLHAVLANSYNGDVDYTLPQIGTDSAVATWQFDGLAKGRYKVEVTYPSIGIVATNAHYYLNGNRSKSYIVDQTKAPVGVTANGQNWLPLDTVASANGTVKVELTNEAVKGYVIADAVRIEKVDEQSADVSITLMPPDSLKQAGRGVYKAVITNNSNSDASDVHVRMPIPKWLVFLRDTTNKDFCYQQGTDSICDLPTLKAGEVKSLDLGYAVQTIAPCWSTTQGQAFVSASTPDPDRTNNDSALLNTTISCDGTPPAGADISIGIGGDTVIQAGNIAHFTVLTSNNSTTTTSQNVQVAATLPQGTSLDSSTDARCTTTGNATPYILCTMNSMAPQATDSVKINLKTAIGLSFQGKETVGIKSDTPDPNTDNNSASLNISIVGGSSSSSSSSSSNSSSSGHTDISSSSSSRSSSNASSNSSQSTTDLSITQTLTPSTTASTMQVTGTVVNGGIRTTNAVISVQLPAGVTLLLGSDDNCTATPNTLGTLIACSHGTLETSLPPSSPWQFKFIEKFTTFTATPATHTIQVTSDLTDSNPANNSASAQYSLIWPDVSVHDTSLGQGEMGTTATLSSSVLNAGPATAQNLILKYTIPQGFTFHSTTSAECTATADPRIIKCTRPSLSKNDLQWTTSIMVDTPAAPAGTCTDATLELKEEVTTDGDSNLSDNINTRNFILTCPKKIAVSNLRVSSIPPSLTSLILAGGPKQKSFAFKLKAENQDVNLKKLVITADGHPASIDHISIVGFPGNVSAIDATTQGCKAASSDPTKTIYCADYLHDFPHGPFLLPANSELILTVMPQLKSDIDGAVAGENITLSLDGKGIEADDAVSRAPLVLASTTTADKGKIIVESQDEIIHGGTSTVILSKIESILRAAQDVVAAPIPQGLNNIGTFAITAADNRNSNHGYDAVRINSIVFGVDFQGLSLGNQFSLVNLQDTSKSSPCSYIGAIFDTIPRLLVKCEKIGNSINSKIPPSENIKLALMGYVQNPVLDPSRGSLLQTSIVGVNSQGGITWSDVDDAATTDFNWVDYPAATVQGTLFINGKTGN